MIGRKQNRLPPQELKEKKEQLDSIIVSIESNCSELTKLSSTTDELKTEKRKLKESLSKMKKELANKKARRMRRSKSLENLLQNILDDVGIKRKSYHGGQWTGVYCRRFLENMEKVMDELKKVSINRLHEVSGIEEIDTNRCSLEQLTTTIEKFANLFRTIDVVFALLRIPDPSNGEVKEVTNAIKVLETLWIDLKLNVTPKIHILFNHTISQYKRYGGIANKVEDFVEKFHQVGKQLDHLVSRMSSQSY